MEETDRQRMFSVENESGEAYRMANEAITRIMLLEKANDDKFAQLLKQIGELKSSLNKLFDRFWMAAVGVIAILLAVSGYLYIESSRINKEFMAQVIHATKSGTP